MQAALLKSTTRALAPLRKTMNHASGIAEKSLDESAWRAQQWSPNFRKLVNPYPTLKFHY